MSDQAFLLRNVFWIQQMIFKNYELEITNE